VAEAERGGKRSFARGLALLIVGIGLGLAGSRFVPVSRHGLPDDEAAVGATAACARCEAERGLATRGEVRPGAGIAGGSSRAEIVASDATNETSDLAPLVAEPVGRALRGTVHFRSASPIERVSVHLAALAAGREPDLEILSQFAPSAIVERAAPHFVIGDLPPGDYVVGIALGAGGRVVDHVIATVGAGVVAIELEAAQPDVTRGITVTLLAPEGEREPNAEFHSSARGARRTWSKACTSIPMADGRHWLDLDLDAIAADLASDGGEVACSIAARSPRFGTAAGTIERGQRELTIRFEEPAILELALQGHLGTTYEDRVGIELALGGGSRDFDVHAPRADGAVRIGPIAPGAYRMLISILEEGGRREPVAVERLVLVSGPNRLGATVPPLSSLVVETAPGTAGAIHLAGDLGERTRKLNAATGRATFDHLPPGEYRVSYRRGELSGQAKVRLPDVSQLALPLTSLSR
jgi:hypothetical protein